MTKLPLVWLDGLKGKEREDLEYLLKNNRTMIFRLLEILDKYETEETKQETNQSDYDSPSWGYKQADRNGARRAYRKIKSLFQYMETSH